uniref:Amino acid permease n=1 Tax=Plectus sambesii TaxID=2011161 RepID=A0A914UH90_9BILA
MSIGDKLRAFLRSLTTVKTLSSLKSQNASSELKRALGPMELIAIGIGAIIGTGIFVLTGAAAAKHSGPAVVLSFVLAGITAAFAALSYAELASMIPIAGSAYTYTYATMGEFVAWIIGWDLILEYLVGAATVSVGWSRYTVSLLEDIFSTNFSTTLTQAPVIFNEHTHEFVVTGNYFNLPAVVIVLTITVLLMF